MDTFEQASPATRQPNQTQAVCWECGQDALCFEYVVCCTGSLFHVCPACEERLAQEDEDSGVAKEGALNAVPDPALITGCPTARPTTPGETIP